MATKKSDFFVGTRENESVMTELPNKGWIYFRVKPEEYNKMHDYFSQTTCRKLSEYARNVLLMNWSH